MKTNRIAAFPLVCMGLMLWVANASAQSLVNIDFGVGSASAKHGWAATGQGTNDYWNLFRFYEPKYSPGMPLIFSGTMSDLKQADGTPTALQVSVTNAPGIWGNASGDPMFDSYIFAQNGSDVVVTLSKLEAGHYSFYIYGHADADAGGEQNSVFRIQCAGTNYGPLTTVSAPGWRISQGWQEGVQYVAFRDVEVKQDCPVVIQVSPGPNGVAVLNGMQIVSKGTSPPRLLTTAQAQQPASPTNLIVHEIRYTGNVSEDAAQFTAELQVECIGTNLVSTPLFQGDIAVITKTLPEGLQIARVGNEYRLMTTTPGVYKAKLDLAARITRAEPWNQISFAGPVAAIASITAAAEGEGVELQLLSGNSVETNRSKSRIEGFLSADRLVALRWQSKSTEVVRKALVTVETACSAQISPTVVRLSTDFKYEFLQAGVSRLGIAIPNGQALTRLQGEQIRDWRIAPGESNQILTIEFIRPIEKNWALTVFSEQTVNSSTVDLAPPQPLGVERESGMLMLRAEGGIIGVTANSGLRQISAPEGALAAYRFYGRPLRLEASVRQIEPEIKIADSISVRLEETRFLAKHAISLTVEKAGIYALELALQPGFVVGEVTGEGIEDWKVSDGKLRLSFANRVLGERVLVVQLEQALKAPPPQLELLPLRVGGATRQAVQIGAAAAPGLRLRTADLTALTEIPVSQLKNHRDELLAFSSQEPDWKLVLGSQKLPARINTEIFNLITVGDGLVGGSATVRYGIVNQGVQQFRLRVPTHWKNIEFTGPNIRGKEQQGDTWTVNLQDKVWEGYTLVVTYDYQFDPAKALLDAGGLHALDAEHESGSVAITTAASLKLQPEPVEEPLRVIDPTELADCDRALITRPVLLAYRYSGSDYKLRIQTTRHAEERGLDAVADRTQITSVLAESGEMLTQASFMVKNNDKQFQRFQLPTNATFWGCYVNNQPSKAERDGSWLLVSLPRTENRDEAFAVDLVYIETNKAPGARFFPKAMQFQAPTTDVPNTYAEWELYVPRSQKLMNFGGTMTVARGTTYSLDDAWQRFREFYASAWKEDGGALVFFGVIILFVTLISAGASRRGWNGVLTALGILTIMLILASMLLPALSSAKQKAQRISAVNNLKQIGTALRVWSGDNNDGPYPASLEECKAELGNSDRVLIDPGSGQPFVYVGAGKSDTFPQAVIAYTPVDNNGRAVLLGDGSVQQMSSERFAQALEEDARMAYEYAKARENHTHSAQPQVATVQPPPVQQHVTNTPAASQPTVTANPAQATAMAAGVRSIRIELPRNGQPFTFTKVLNTSSEPLSVNVSMMSATVYSVFRSALQSMLFVSGLLLFWLNRRTENTLRITIGLALALGALAALFITARALHIILIIVVPVVVIGGFILVLVKFWPRKPAFEKTSSPPDTSSGIPPVTACLALLLLTGITARAQLAPGEPVLAPAIISAEYSGTVHEFSGKFDGKLKIQTAATNQAITLFGDDVAVGAFEVVSGNATLMRQGGRLTVMLPNSGITEVQLKFLVKLGGSVGKRQLSFQLPPALCSHLNATIDEPEADVEFLSAVAFKRTNAGQQTRVEATIGSTDRVDLQWAPRVKRATEIAATIFAESHSLVTVGGGVLDVRSTFDYQISQGELRQARLSLPEKQRLLRVEGASIRTWDVKEENGHGILTIDLLKGASAQWQVSVETEAVLETLPVTATVQVPHALDVKRENGLVAVRSSEEVSVSVTDAQMLQRVDSDEFGLKQDKSAEALIVYRFLRPDFGLSIAAEAVRPHVEAVVQNHVRISSDQIGLTSKLDYTIKRAGIFGLKLALPSGYQVQSVSGENIENWTTTSEGPMQTLNIAFKNRSIGTYALEIASIKKVKELSKVVAVESVFPLEVNKLSGFVMVYAEPGITVKTSALDGMVEIPPAASGSTNSAGAPVLAYKFLNTHPGLSPEWKLQVGTEVSDSWIRAEIAHVLTLSDTIINGKALVRFEVQNAPVKDFRIKIPTNCANVEITGPNIRRRDQNGDEWRIELQKKVNGLVPLTVTWEEPANCKASVVEPAAIQALDVERQTGLIFVKARAPLQVLEKSIQGELMRVDVREAPDWIANDVANDSDPVVLAYRHVRPGYKLALQAKRYEEASVLQAIVDDAHFTTVLAADGQVMTELFMSVRNNGMQHLEIALPDKSQLWSAFVGGQPVHPARRAGKLLLPLETTLADGDAPITVELIYVNAGSFPKIEGVVHLDSPALDVPLKNARWDLYLPLDYDYSKFRGSMAHVSEVTPIVQTYSLFDYRAQEAGKKASRKVETVNNLRSFSKQLASGNTKSINSAYNKLRSEGAGDENTRHELADIQSNIRRIQGSNLIQAQRAYSGRSAGQKSSELYEADVAEQQWSKLQQAQEMVMAKIQPLHINLPTRGVHHGFTQVLQTAVQKPLTVEFTASNTAHQGWVRPILLGAFGFLSLWVMVFITKTWGAAKDGN